MNEQDWGIIRSVVASHEAEAHGGKRCTCPAMHRALKAAKAFEKQFGRRTKPGVMLDEFDDKRGRWKTRTWMDAESTLLDAKDFNRLPKDVQQQKMRWLSEELEHGQAVLEAEMPGAPKRKSPRERTKQVVRDLLKGAHRTATGFTFTESVNKDIGMDDVTAADLERYAVRKLEEDRRKQRKVDMGWSPTSLSDSAPPKTTSRDGSSKASSPATPDGPDSPSEPSTSSPDQT